MSEDATDIIETKMESINKKLKFADRLLKEVYEMLNGKTDTVKGVGKPSGNSYEEKQRVIWKCLIINESENRKNRLWNIIK